MIKNLLSTNVRVFNESGLSTAEFKDIAPVKGFFEFDGFLYLKTKLELNSDTNDFNAINISLLTKARFASTEEVTPVGEVSVTYIKEKKS